MASIDLIRASNGSGDAVKATVTNARVISSTTLQVSAITNFPSKFIATVGSVDGTGAFVPATVTVFNGHTSGGNIEIDSFAPGYTDLGNTPGQIVVLKPTTAWANEIGSVLDAVHNDNGTLKANSVNTAAITNANVTTAKIADTAVTASKIDFTTLLLGMITPIVVNQGAASMSDMIGSSLTINIPAGRKVRLAWSVPLMSLNVSGSRLAVQLNEGSTVYRVWSQVRQFTLGSEIAGETILTGLSGSHTFKLVFGTEIGSGTTSTNADAAHPVEFYAEIVG